MADDVLIKWKQQQQATTPGGFTATLLVGKVGGRPAYHVTHGPNKAGHSHLRYTDSKDKASAAFELYSKDDGLPSAWQKQLGLIQDVTPIQADEPEAAVDPEAPIVAKTRKGRRKFEMPTRADLEKKVKAIRTDKGPMRAIVKILRQTGAVTVRVELECGHEVSAFAKGKQARCRKCLKAGAV